MITAYRSVISGNPRDDKHQEKGGDEFHGKGLAIGSHRHCAKIGLIIYIKHKAQHATRKYGS